MNQDIIRKISEYEQKGDFTYTSISDSDVHTIEQEMGVHIPEEYLWFLKTYGHGGLNGIETLGIGKNGKLIFKDATLKNREYGLPGNLIVIENCDEWLYCLDSNTGEVKMWAPNDAGTDDAYDSFIAYLDDRVNDAIENM